MNQQSSNEAQQAQQNPQQQSQQQSQPQTNAQQSEGTSQNSGQQPSQQQQAQQNQQQSPQQSPQAQSADDKPQGSQEQAQDELNKLDEKQQQTKENFATTNISRESASMLNLLMEQIKTLVEVSNNLNDRTKEVEKRVNELSVDAEKTKESNKIMNEKMDMMEKNMEKFIGLYEVVTNQYNPFLEGNEGKQKAVEEEEEVLSSGNNNQSNGRTQQNMQSAMNNAGPQVNDGVPQAQPGQDRYNNNMNGHNNPQEQQPPGVPRVSNNQQQEEGYQGGASFSFEDRITGERGHVGQQIPDGSSGYQNNGYNPYQQGPQNNQTGNPQMNQGQFQNQPGNLGPQNQMSDNGQNFPPGVNYHQQNNNQYPGNFAPSMPQQAANMQNANAPQPHPRMNSRNFAVPEEKGNMPFVLPNGKQVGTLQDLLEEIAVMDDNSFFSMVNNQQNHIANWVINSLGDMKLGSDLFRSLDRQSTIKTISRYIHNRPTERQVDTSFRFVNGKVVNDIESMMDELIYSDENTFSAHVNNSKNDIADWVQGSLGIHDLANRVRNVRSKTDMIRELALYLHSNN